MKRILAIAVVGLACLTSAACQTAVSGSALSNGGVSTPVAAASAPGSAAASSSPGTSGPPSSVAPASGAAASSDPPGSPTVSSTTTGSTTSDAGSGNGNTGGNSGSSGGTDNSGGSGGSGGSGDGSGAGDHQPTIVSLKVTCTFDANQMEYVASAHYRVANASGLAVSVDDPGTVGSFGSAKGTEGDIDLPSNGCYADSGEQVYDFDTTGGSPPAHQEIKRTGTHQRGDKPAPSAPSAPKVTQAGLICSKQDDGSYHLTLQWAVANATGMALSVDNPGGVGSFGTYNGTSGNVDLPSNACYSDAGSHEFDLQTVGGADPQATRVLNFNGGHRRPGSGSTTSSSSTTTTTSTTTTPPPPGG